jgi:hypothetical protein
MRKLFFLLTLMAILAGCVYNNEEELYPDAGVVCDTAAVTYSRTVLPILQASCFVCHSASESSAFGGSLNFEDTTLFRALVSGGNLYGAITHDPKFIPMPQNRPMLDSCSIAKIRAWIGKGARFD